MLSKYLLLTLTLITSSFVIPVYAYLGKATYAVEFDFQDSNTLAKIKQAMKESGLPYIVAYEDENAPLNIVLLIDSEKTETFKNSLTTITNTISPVKNITLTDFDNSAVCIF